MLWAGEGGASDGRAGLEQGRGGAQERGSASRARVGARGGAQSRVPTGSHRKSVLLQPSANVALQYASHGAKGQLLPLGLETPIAASAQFGPE